MGDVNITSNIQEPDGFACIKVTMCAVGKASLALNGTLECLLLPVHLLRELSMTQV